MWCPFNYQVVDLIGENTGSQWRPLENLNGVFELPLAARERVSNVACSANQVAAKLGSELSKPEARLGFRSGGAQRVCEDLHDEAGRGGEAPSNPEVRSGASEHGSQAETPILCYENGDRTSR